MKINPDQLAALHPDAERNTHKTSKSGERFEDLLARAAEKVGAGGQEQSQQAVGPLQGPGSAGHLTATQLLFPSAAPRASETKAMDTIDNLLSQWENYADQLAAAPQGLRNAHDILNRISSEIGDLKANLPQGGAVPGLRNMVDELEVLAVTERIKFDRGDYV